MARGMSPAWTLLLPLPLPTVAASVIIAQRPCPAPAVSTPLWFIWDSRCDPPCFAVDIDASVAGFLIIPVTKPPFKFAMNAKQGQKTAKTVKCFFFFCFPFFLFFFSSDGNGSASKHPKADTVAAVR